MNNNTISKKKTLLIILIISAVLIIAAIICTIILVTRDDEQTPDTPTPSAPVLTTTVDKTEWEKAFDDMPTTNFTINSEVFVSQYNCTEYGYGEYSNDAIYNKLKQNSELCMEMYLIKNADDTVSIYSNDLTDAENSNSTANKYILTVDDDWKSYIRDAEANDDLIKYFADYYDLFSYNENDKSYKYDGEIKISIPPDPPISPTDLTCTDIVIKFENGKLIAISFKYINEREPDQDIHIMNLTNIGTTKVVIPEEVINNAVAKD